MGGERQALPAALPASGSADDSDGPDDPGDSGGEDGQPTGRRRRALAAAAERAAAQEAGARTVFALPPADADRTPDVSAATAAQTPGFRSCRVSFPVVFRVGIPVMTGGTTPFRSIRAAITLRLSRIPPVRRLGDGVGQLPSRSLNSRRRLGSRCRRGLRFSPVRWFRRRVRPGRGSRGCRRGSVPGSNRA